jgi:HEAT repeat protein
MNSSLLNASPIAASSLVAAASLAEAPASLSVNDLQARLKSPDETVSSAAVEAAPAAGAAGIQPLGVLMADSDFELARRAQRAAYRIVRSAGRPGAGKEAQAVEDALIKLLETSSGQVRREVLGMLSEIGGDAAVKPLAAMLSDPEAREAARCALLRMPGRKATAALRGAMKSAPEEFKFALADALRRRGEKVEGYPTRKLVPVGQTTVVPIPPKSK